MIDLTGKKFGRLIVLKCVKHESPGDYLWECKCDCGTIKSFRGMNLRSGDSKSCGCLLAECRRSNGKKNKTHGHTKTATYETWHQLRKRCLNVNDKDYKNYGGRGIIVCQRWAKFENFLKDMGEKPKSKCIDRIDNDGNYELSNCRWATALEQCRNKRTSLKYTFDGKTKFLIEWSRELKIAYPTLRGRLIDRKWDVAKAFTMSPTDYHGR